MSRCLLVVALILPAAVAQTGSYHRVEGARRTRFERTRGVSEIGHAIRLDVPERALGPGKLTRHGRGRRFLSFAHKGVTYVVERTNPYLVQTLRKLARGRSTKKVILKGKVLRRSRRGQKTPLVLLEVLQATAGKRLPGRKKAMKTTGEGKKTKGARGALFHRYESVPKFGTPSATSLY